MPFDDNETSDSDSQGLHQSKRTRRLELVQDLLRSIDALAFVEIAILYYCDNATALLFTRSLIQLLFLTPRSPTLPDLPARPHVGLVLGTSAFSVLFHLRKQPRPPETTRGYLTGFDLSSPKRRSSTTNLSPVACSLISSESRAQCPG